MDGSPPPWDRSADPATEYGVTAQDIADFYTADDIERPLDVIIDILVRFVHQDTIVHHAVHSSSHSSNGLGDVDDA